MPVNVPVTIWRDPNGLTEYSGSGVYDIDDPSGVLLVDTNSDNIVDTGVLATLIPSTEWVENDGV